MRRTNHQSSSVACSPTGTFLNRFCGTACETEYLEDQSDSEQDIEFEQALETSPILRDMSKSRTVLLGGDTGNVSKKILGDRSAVIVQTKDRLRRGFRSKRSEERYKLSHMVFNGPVRVRIMDVDAFNLEELHHYFMYTMVRRFPAEDCMKLTARIALFRDKNSQRSFECMSRDVVEMFGPVHGPELSALFSRCYITIPIAFMLDYIRRFGRFSRKFIAQQVDKTLNPRLFDIVRYPGGVKPLPSIVTRPFALRSFAQLLPPCSAKKYIFQHLLARTGDAKALESIRARALEDEAGLLEFEASRLDPLLGPNARVMEKVLNSRRLRPKQIEAYQSDVSMKQPVSPEDIVKSLESQKSNKVQPAGGLYDLQFTQVQSFQSPLLEDTDAIAHIDKGGEEGMEEELVPAWRGEEESSGETWYRCDRGKFFRYNKKAYRMVDGEGWKQITDPRGELPDYARAKAFRNKEKGIARHYGRIRRMKERKQAVLRIVKSQLAS